MAHHEQFSGQIPYFFEMNGSAATPNINQSEVAPAYETVATQRELTQAELDALMNYEYELPVVNSNQ